MITLKLFNAVLSKKQDVEPFISTEGYIIEPSAIWAKKEIIDFYTRENLDGNDLNKTFHKSWDKIKNSDRFDLLLEQIKHYVSTYGTNFKGDVYIPQEILKIPDLKIKFKVIKSYTIDEMQQKCLYLLESGIALKEDTINDLLTTLVDHLDYTFTGNENIKNKEAIIKIADMYGIIPNDTLDFLRYILYKTTGESLLIKNDNIIKSIKISNYNPAAQFKQFGLKRLAEVFNRFKPLFLAYKSKCGNTINKISKLSKKYHKPLVSNPLNSVTNILLTYDDTHWLDNATPYALFKALSACYSRMMGQNHFIYRIRNGKSWTSKNNNVLVYTNTQNYKLLLSYISGRFDLSDKKIYFPKGVDYALPTSEKMFVGNVPTGTKFTGKKLAVGVYWQNDWGANDLDLSGLNIGGKIGWNAEYNQGGDLLYSGDLTDAADGAVEYLYANKGLSDPTLVMNNVFSGLSTAGYNIIIGKGDKISHEFMMNPNKLFVDIKTQSIQINTILGIFLPNKKQQTFVLLNFGAGHVRVSRNTGLSYMSTLALFQQWHNSLSFNELVHILGAKIISTPTEDSINFDLNNLEKDSFIKLFQ